MFDVANRVLQVLELQLQMLSSVQQGRVLVTHDTDFLKLASQSLEHSGIAFCRQDTRTIGEIIRSLVLIYEILTPEEMKRRIEYL